MSVTPLCMADRLEFDDFRAEEIDTALHQLSLAASGLSELDAELAHLIDRSRYYNEPPTTHTLEDLRKRLSYLMKIVE